jgi:ABC-type polysaccharide/polyol phosphate transport system ATPase subunit
LRSASDPLIPDDLAIRAEDVTIRYRTQYEKVPTLKSALKRRLGRREGRKKAYRIVEAVRGVSFDVPHGTVMGIVGANGAGKSTMMRVLAGILAPTEGRVIVNGQVSTLLSLGVGFNATLSGRENVILGGLAAGLSVDALQEKFEEIAEFADLPEGFIDMPMRTYSSGMYGRLAFAVSVNMEPDILLIDEALATGDAAFKEKSLGKMHELVGEARTIVIVSHALGTIRELCNRAIWMHNGELIQIGDPDSVVEAYMKFLKVGESAIALEDV